jgi:hypothetical protein
MSIQPLIQFGRRPFMANWRSNAFQKGWASGRDGVRWGFDVKDM